MLIRVTGTGTLQEIIEKALGSVAPPPNMTVSQWADKYRMIPQEGGSEPGPWNTDRAPFQREPMDVITDPDVYEVVIAGSVQLLKSEVLLNAIGYFMHLDPCPMMMVQPDEKNAAEFSNDRIAAMIEATPVLRERVFSRRGGGTKTSGQFNIRFQGGYLAIASANVPASLRSKPVRVVFMDEVEAYPHSSRDEGDPLGLAEKRTTNFWNRKIFKTSSPKLVGGRILTAYEQSDRRKYHVPCLECGEKQILRFGGKDRPYGLKWVHGKPSTVVYICQGCGAAWKEADKEELLQNGQWIPEAEFNGRAGFWINSLYSPWFSWEQLVQEYLVSKDDPTQLQSFVNTRLAEGWEERGESVRESLLMARREDYAAPVPMKAFILTCGVDVQADRLEALVCGWGKQEECWFVDHTVFWGNPDENQVWRELESYLSRNFRHESGVNLKLTVTMIDAGYKAQRVYEFVDRCSGRVFASAGRSGWGLPTVKVFRPESGKDRRKVDLHIVAVDEVKDTLIRRLKKQPGEPFSCHFPKTVAGEKTDWCHEEFFAQLTAEKLVIVRDKLGRQTRTWKKIRDRNEIWDLFGLNYAGTKLLSSNWQDWEALIVPTQEKGTHEPTVPKKRVISEGLTLDDL